MSFSGLLVLLHVIGPHKTLMVFKRLFFKIAANSLKWITIACWNNSIQDGDVADWFDLQCWWFVVIHVVGYVIIVSMMLVDVDCRV